ncbi:hypothetical protein CPT_Mijalis121 [Citrobacter phage Mijalis]|uniref:Uncharacterized protein n=1 Tax=Citrobacter phage Mijalis TaxID=1965456 RepID=A0A1V0DYZ5_9CAUD|nr:hypothetical protein CPT_Mijalis121 [Citrobacter phage Mijalis]
MKVLIVRNKKTRQIIASGIYVGRSEVIPFTEVFSHKETFKYYLDEGFLRSNVESFKQTFTSNRTVTQEVILNG